MAAASMLLAVAAAGVAAAQQATFRAAVNGVRLDVLVVDDGRPVPGLSSADFQVLDNGVPQKITAVQAESTPLDVVFTLDRSESVAGETLVRLKGAVHATLDALRDPDRAAVLTFSHELSLDAPLTADRAVLRRAVDRVAAAGATSAIDAAYGALSLAEGTGRRTLVLLFSDGFDNRSWLTTDEIIRAARESEAVICGVAYLPPSPRGGQGELAPHVELLRDLSRATGGEVVEIRRGADLASTFTRILSTMRARYLLTYVAAAETPGWHEVSVRVRASRAKVVARPGYFVR